jgi:hypothetical protein
LTSSLLYMYHVLDALADWMIFKAVFLDAPVVHEPSPLGCVSPSLPSFLVQALPPHLPRVLRLWCHPVLPGVWRRGTGNGAPLPPPLPRPAVVPPRGCRPPPPLPLWALPRLPCGLRHAAALWPHLQQQHLP